MPTLAPASAASSVPLAAGPASAQPVAIPPAGGVSGSLMLPAATIPAGTSLNVSTSTTLPAGLTALNAGRRVQSAGFEVLYYQGLQFTQTVTFSGYPAFTINLPAGYDPSRGFFYLAFFDGSGWTYPLGAAAVPNGQVLNFAAAAGPVTYNANQFYYFALYYAPTPPSPTPTPTSSPSPAPTATATASPVPSFSPSPTPVPTATPTPGPLTATPNTLSFLGTGSDLTQTVTASSSFYTGGFTASPCVNNGGSATIATVSAVAANGTFTVTPVAAGACTITVTDSAARTTTVAVTVATSSLTIQRKH